MIAPMPQSAAGQPGWHSPQPSAPVASQGAIFQAAAYRPLFEDQRARLVGDTLTIVIEETVTASQKSTSKIDRGNSLSASISAIPFGSSRTLGPPGASDDGLRVTLPAPDLGEGSYTLAFRVTSTVDGHTTGGAITFGIGEPPPAPGAPG